MCYIECYLISIGCETRLWERRQNDQETVKTDLPPFKLIYKKLPILLKYTQRQH